MTFNPNFILKGLDGKPIKGEMDNIHAGKVLAAALFYDQKDKEQRLKYHGWALKLYDMQSIEIDESDRKLLISFVEKNEFPPVTYAPLMKMLEGLKDKVKSNGMVEEIKK